MIVTQPISSFMERQVWSADMDDTIAEVESLFARQGLSWARSEERRVGKECA